MSDLREGWLKLQGEGLYAYTRLVTKTSRWQFAGKPNLTMAKSSGRPIMFCLWHGQLMPFTAFGVRFERADSFAAVAVGDERSTILGTMATRMGAETFAVDMGGNPVAAGRNVLLVIKAMKAGRNSFIAPDGPDGPPYVPKRGIAKIARKAEAAIMPVGLWTRQAFQMRRWDRYLVPLPFARIHMVFEEPIMVSKKMDRDALLAQVTAAMHRARTAAQILAGIEPWM